MRKLDRYTIDTRGPRLNKFICDWLNNSGPRVFNYEGDTFELRVNGEIQKIYEIYVNGEFSFKTFNAEAFKIAGHKVYQKEIFRDVRGNAKERTLYDYTALLRNENPNYGVYCHSEGIRDFRKKFKTNYTDEYLKDKTNTTTHSLSEFDVKLSYYKLVYEIVLIRMECGLSHVDALNVTYAVCADKPTVDKMREVLLCGEEESSEYDIRAIVTRNIVCHDPDTYDGSFNGTDLTDAELAIKSEFNLAW